MATFCTLLTGMFSVALHSILKWDPRPSKRNYFIFFNKSALKMMKNAFFHLKSSFRSQDILIFS